jgi:tRNA(Ile)-lysidine synthase
MVLLDVLSGLAPTHGLALEVGHVHHGLRGMDADQDAEAVESRANALGLGFRVEHVVPGELRENRSNRERPTVQEAARTLRYEALRRMAARCGAVHVATAHTLDDQAETVLMRVLRGAGADSLGGIPECSADGVVIRPLLTVGRKAIQAYAAECGVRWREDDSNQNDRYTRNRLRHHWLPGLSQEFNPRLLRAIGRLAEAHRRDAEWIDEMVEAATNRLTAPSPDGRGGLELQKDGWLELPEALARRVVRRMLIRMQGGRDVSHAHIVRVLAFLRRDRLTSCPRTLELPGGLRIDATIDAVRLYRARD